MVVQIMFDGVRRAYDLQILYVMEVIELLGTDKAIELLEKASKRQGMIITRGLRKKIPEDLSSIEIGAEVYRRFMEDAGAEIKVYKQDEKSVTFLIDRCPFFEAFLDVGVDCGMFLNGLCTHLTLPSIQATLIEFDSKLRVEPIVTRESAEEFCLERVFLAE
jgi:hypothetical protein